MLPSEDAISSSSKKRQECVLSRSILFNLEVMAEIKRPLSDKHVLFHRAFVQ